MSSFSEQQRRLKEKAAQEAIFQATVKLIAEKGGDALTMQEIAASVGIATGTLYNYFKNKVELLYFVDRQLHELILAEGEAIVGSDAMPVIKLELLVGRILDFCREYHSVFALADQFGIKDRIPRQEKDENVNAGYRCFENVIRAGIHQGVFKPVNTAAVAEMFFAAVIGVAEVQKWRQEYQTQQQTQKLMTFFLDGLKP